MKLEPTPETRRLLNPAFIAMIIAFAAEGYEDEMEEGLPFLYSFVIAAMVLHRTTRESLPKSITSKLSEWSKKNSISLVEIPEHAVEISKMVRRSILLGYNFEFLEMDTKNRIVSMRSTSLAKASSNAKGSVEIPDIYKKSKFLGRWLANSGTQATVLSILGIGVENASI